MKWLLSFFLIFSLVGCSKKREITYQVGIDPGFYSVELLGQEPNVLAFCNELLDEISRMEGRRYRRGGANWGNLREGLDKGVYPIILSSLQPYVFNEKKYRFSNPVILTGPVLVVPVNSRVKGFDDLDGSEVLILNALNEHILTLAAPGVIPREGVSLPQAMLDLSNGKYDALFVEGLPSFTYVNNLYPNELKVITSPYGDEGLRFIALQSDESGAFERLNKALLKLEKSGWLKKLRQKWKIG